MAAKNDPYKIPNMQTQIPLAKLFSDVEANLELWHGNRILRKNCYDLFRIVYLNQ